MVVEAFFARLDSRTAKAYCEHTNSCGESWLIWNTGSTVPFLSAARRWRSKKNPQLCSAKGTVCIKFRSRGKTYVDRCHSWSLGRTIDRSLQLPLRILAANILRELSLAAIDLRLLWPAQMHDSNVFQLSSRFIADSVWLESTIEQLHHVDNDRAVPQERYRHRPSCSFWY